MGHPVGDPTRDLRHNGDSKASDTEKERKDDRTMATTFDPINYKKTTRDQWQRASEAWNRWGPFIDQWLGAATEMMLDLVNVRSGSRVLDVAAGAGCQTAAADRRVGLSGYVLATDISSNILEFAASNARAAGLTNVETRVLDGENLDVEPGAFDAVISRVGLIYFPDQQKALSGMRRALKPGGRVAAIVYTIAENNKFFSLPVAIIRRRAQLPPPLPGQPGPFSLGTPGVLEEAYRQAGFHDIQTRIVPAPLHLSSAEECVRFERESFGALHHMLSGLIKPERASVCSEIANELRLFEIAND